MTQPKPVTASVSLALLIGALCLTLPTIATAACQNHCQNATTSPCRIGNATDCIIGGVDLGPCGATVPACCDSAEVSNAKGGCACGDRIEGGVSLEEDLTCSSGNGLILDGNSGVLNLNGHAIVCSNSNGCGIGVKMETGANQVKGSDAEGGRILGWAYGVDGGGYATTTAGPRLTVADNGHPMLFGIANVAKVEDNLVIGAAVSYAGNGIHVGANCTRIHNNIVTDSIRGIALASTGAGCEVSHNRAIGNEFGFAAPTNGTFDTAQSVDNVFLYNSSADYWDIYTSGISSSRLDPDENVCQVAYGGYSTCTLVGFHTP